MTHGRIFYLLEIGEGAELPMERRRASFRILYFGRDLCFHEMQD